METIPTIVVSALVGAVGWSLAEYLLHDLVGHRMKGRTAGAREHLRHHAVRGYFAPASWKAKQGVLLALLTVPLAVAVFGAPAGVAGTVGFYAAYLGYEVVHRRLHTHAPRHRYARLLRLHHFAHHFRYPNRNHGVTTPLWDLLFRTYVQPQLPLPVPRKHAMEWLVDPESGAIRPEFASDYVLVGRTPAT